jgi:hypothetical protein
MKIQVPGRYPDREYGHCLLGNGVDLLYVDWSGAMTFKDHIGGIFGYWYKLDRKAAPQQDPLPLLRVKYCLVSEAGPIEIAGSKQTFDPETATLTSEIDGGPFKFTVTSFLTNDHLFVMNLKFETFPEGGSIYFALDDNRSTYTGKLIQPPSEPICYSVEDGKILARFADKRECPFEGVGVMQVVGSRQGEIIEAIGNVSVASFGSQADKSDEAAKKSPLFPYLTSGTLIKVDAVKAGGELTCYTCLVDDMDGVDDVDGRAEDIIQQAVQAGCQAVWQKHAAGWREYMGTASIGGHPEIDYQYKLSRYVLKAIQYPTGAMVPSPVFPNNHGCLVYWDAMYDQIGFLRNGNIAESEKIARLWIRGLPFARSNAQSLGKKGAFFGWTIDFQGNDPFFTRVNQVHYNGDIAFSAWLHFLYTRDVDYLRDAFPVIKDAIDFLIDAYVEEEDGQLLVKECETLDESAYERTGDTWTTSLIITGIDHIIEAANTLVEAIDSSEYLRVREGLIGALKSNSANGILHSNAEMGDLNVGSILSLIILGDSKPSGIDDMRTYQRYLENVMETSGVGWGHSSRMRCEIFPWAELMVTVFLAQREDNSRTEEHIERAMHTTNSFGGFAEYLWIHGAISRQWYASAHSTFLWALSEMMVSTRGDGIVLFPGTPPDYRTLSFRDIVLPGNIRVSANMKDWKVSGVTLTNADKEDVVRRVRLGSIEKTVTLPAGETIEVEW